MRMEYKEFFVAAEFYLSSLSVSSSFSNDWQRSAQLLKVKGVYRCERSFFYHTRHKGGEGPALCAADAIARSNEYRYIENKKKKKEEERAVEVSVFNQVRLVSWQVRRTLKCSSGKRGKNSRRARSALCALCVRARNQSQTLPDDTYTHTHIYKLTMLCATRLFFRSSSTQVYVCVCVREPDTTRGNALAYRCVHECHTYMPRERPTDSLTALPSLSLSLLSCCVCLWKTDCDSAIRVYNAIYDFLAL